MPCSRPALTPRSCPGLVRRVVVPVLAGCLVAALGCSGGGGGTTPAPTPAKPNVVVLKSTVTLVDTVVQSGGPVTASIDLLVGYDNSSTPVPVIDSVTLKGVSAGQPDINFTVPVNGTNVLSIAPTTQASTVSADATYTFTGTMNVKDVQSNNAIKAYSLTAAGALLVKKPALPQLVVTGSLTITPATLESHDPIAYHMVVSSSMLNYGGSGVPLISDYQLDINGDGINDQLFTPPLNTTSVDYTDNAIATYVSITTIFSPRLTARVLNPSTGQVEAFTFETTYTVNPEKDGYAANYVDSKAYIMDPNNNDYICNFLATSQNLDPGTPEEWKAVFVQGFDGVTSNTNLEITQLVFNDRAKQIIIQVTYGGGILAYGASWTNLTPEIARNFDAFRVGCKAKIP